MRYRYVTMILFLIIVLGCGAYLSMNADKLWPCHSLNAQSFSWKPVACSTPSLTLLWDNLSAIPSNILTFNGSALLTGFMSYTLLMDETKTKSISYLNSFSIIKHRAQTTAMSWYITCIDWYSFLNDTMEIFSCFERIWDIFPLLQRCLEVYSNCWLPSGLHVKSRIATIIYFPLFT